jgi:hypothetical protein
MQDATVCCEHLVGCAMQDATVCCEHLVRISKCSDRAVSAMLVHPIACVGIAIDISMH